MIKLLALIWFYLPKNLWEVQNLFIRHRKLNMTLRSETAKFLCWRWQGFSNIWQLLHGEYFSIESVFRKRLKHAYAYDLYILEAASLVRQDINNFIEAYGYVTAQYVKDTMDEIFLIYLKPLQGD